MIIIDTGKCIAEKHDLNCTRLKTLAHEVADRQQRMVTLCVEDRISVSEIGKLYMSSAYSTKLSTFPHLTLDAYTVYLSNHCKY